MKKGLKVEFGSQHPRAIVLDDSASARAMTARRLRQRGFEVVACADADEFFRDWRPGTADVIIADWQLSAQGEQNGDRVLEAIRRKDWDVPFVLVSGKLDETDDRIAVLSRLLESGAARFVARGSGAIQRACDEAEDLIQRRDLALLKVILGLRPAALAGESVPTTTGPKPVVELLAEAVSQPSASHDFGRPVATHRAKGTRRVARGRRKA